MDQSIHAVLSRIRKYRQHARLTKSGLARKADVSEGILRGMDEDSWNPKTETLKKLESIIPSDFLVDANMSRSP